jgi:polyvinyl alcohol dehydrogenase (cytochrome)
MRRVSPAVAGLGLAVVSLLGLGACDWVTYHGNDTRSGTLAGSAHVRSASTAWQSTLDGAVYGSPVVASGSVFVATEHDTVFALDPASGRQRWRRSVGTAVPRSVLPCGNIDPLGITGTPAFDPATNRLFVVAETTESGRVRHRLLGLDAATGGVVLSRLVPPPVGDETAHQQRGALLVAGGRVYVPYGGLAGDCGAYVGSVVSASTTDAAAPLASFAVPTTREGGIWTPPGPSRLPNGHLLVAVGNSEHTQTAQGYDGGDSVTELTSDLRYVRDFHPSSWAQDNAVDADLGSMGPALVGNSVVQAGKSGTVYVVDAATLGRGWTRTMPGVSCKAFGGSAVSGSRVYLPCTTGTLAVDVDSNGIPTRRWSVAGPGSPVVYGATLVVPDAGAGLLRTYDASTGGRGPTYQIPLGSLTRFATPALDLNRVYIGTTRGVVAVSLVS